MTRRGIISDTISLSSGSRGASPGRASALRLATGGKGKADERGGRDEKRGQWLICYFTLYIFCLGLFFLSLGSSWRPLLRDPPACGLALAPALSSVGWEDMGLGQGASDQVR